jgi:hypothetical protein
VDVLEPEPTPADEHLKGQECMKGQVDIEQSLDVPSPAVVTSDGQTPPPGTISSHGTVAGGLVPELHHSVRVSHEEVCGLLIGRQQDVNVHLLCAPCLVIQWLYL